MEADMAGELERAGGRVYQPRPGRVLRLALLAFPVIREQAGVTPVLLLDFLDHHVGVFGPLAQHPDQGCGDLPHQFGFLGPGGAFGRGGGTRRQTR